MIDLPIGKALVAVESDVHCNYECKDDNYKCTLDCCKGCELEGDEELGEYPGDDPCSSLCCNPFNRKDGKKVIFKVVDYIA